MGLFTKVKHYKGKIGGGFYFMSVMSLMLLSVLSSVFIVKIFLFSSLASQVSPFGHLLFVLIGALIGIVLRGKIAVFLHELKHSIVSGLAGNKAKGMKIDQETGHFEYAFTQATSHLNAFISLAPYTFPIFSLASIPIAILLYSRDPTVSKYLVSCALGIDLLQNAKDIGPHQTDFSQLRGGFYIGMIYVLCFNFILTCLVSVAVVFGYQAFLDFGSWLISFASSSLLAPRSP